MLAYSSCVTVSASHSCCRRWMVKRIISDLDRSIRLTRCVDSKILNQMKPLIKRIARPGANVNVEVS